MSQPTKRRRTATQQNANHPTQAQSQPNKLSNIFAFIWRYAALIFITLLLITSGIYFFRNNNKKCQDFRIVMGDPDNATRILIGAPHTEFHEQKVDQCIGEISASKNTPTVVLVEGALSGNKVLCPDYHVSYRPNQSCEGWNSKEMIQASLNHSIATNFADILAKLNSLIEEEKLSDEDIDHRYQIKLHELNFKYEQLSQKIDIRKYPDNQLLDYSKTEKQFLITRNILKNHQIIHDLRASGETYKQIIENQASAFQKATKEITDYMRTSQLRVLESNKALVNTIHNKWQSFIIAITGNDHVENGAAANYLQKELKSDEQKNPFTIMAI